MKHFLSETAEWQIEAEFVYPDGTIKPGTGEAKIIVGDEKIAAIYSRSIDGKDFRSDEFRIVPLEGHRYLFRRYDKGKEAMCGWCDIQNNSVFLKFFLEDMGYNGFHVFTLKEDICYAAGVMYEENLLLYTWTFRMMKK